MGVIGFYTPTFQNFDFTPQRLVLLANHPLPSRLVSAVNCHVILLTCFFLPNKPQNDIVSMKMKWRLDKCKMAPLFPKRKQTKKKKKRFLYDNFSQTQKLKTQNQQFSSSSSVPLSKGSRHQWWRRILFLLFPTLFCFFLGIMLLDSDLLGGFLIDGIVFSRIYFFFFFYQWICGFVISRFVGFVLY